MSHPCSSLCDSHLYEQLPLTLSIGVKDEKERAQNEQYPGCGAYLSKLSSNHFQEWEERKSELDLNKQNLEVEILNQVFKMPDLNQLMSYVND